MRGNLLVLTVSRVIWSMSNSIVYPYLSLYILELGGSKPVIGLVNAICGLFVYPVGGYIADKSRRARLVGLAIFLYASNFLLFIFAPSW
jgi:predicted MFS family arabinose efflux permease